MKISNLLREVEIKSNQLLINITWKGGGCVSVDYTTVYWRLSPSNSLQNNISLYNTTLLASDPSMNPTTNLHGNGYWSDNSKVFSQPIVFNKETEIDAVIVMSCDKNWADLVIQTPLISPQTHQARARTDPNYSFMHRNFTINSDKYVFYYISNIKVVNQSNSSVVANINYYSIFLQSRFMGCNPRIFESDFGNHNYFTFQYNDLINFSPYGFFINGSITINANFQDTPPSNMTAFIFEYGDTSECLNTSLGSNVNIKNSNNFLYFNDSYQYPLHFFENSLLNSTQKISLSFEQSVKDLPNFIDLIGRSVILRSFSVNTYINISSNPFMLGYVTFSQNYQCQNDAEACLGLILSNAGVCFLVNNDQYYDSYTNFIVKIVVLKKNSTLDKNVKVQIIVNLRYLRDKYTDFSAIVLKNEQNQVNFSVNAKESINYLTTQIESFPLLYDNALGNAFSVKIISQNQRIQLGVCDVVIFNSSFDIANYVQILNAKYPYVNNDEQNKELLVLSLSIGLPLIFLLLVGNFIIFLLFLDFYNGMNFFFFLLFIIFFFFFFISCLVHQKKETSTQSSSLSCFWTIRYTKTP